MTFGCDNHKMELVHPMTIGGDKKYVTYHCYNCSSGWKKKVIVPETLTLDLYHRYFYYNSNYGYSIDNEPPWTKKDFKPEDEELVYEILVDAVKHWNKNHADMQL